MPLTDDPNDPRVKRGPPDTQPVEQHDTYLVLSDAELAQGFVRPFRDAYRHVRIVAGVTNDGPSMKACGAITTMARKLGETYARDPGFYGGTYCSTCKMHRPVAEFTWYEMDGREGPYLGRHTPRAGDHVFHHPTKEKWSVAVDTENGEVIPGGWPLSIAKLEDCDVIKFATDAERLAMLEEVNRGASNDIRGLRAASQLARARAKP